MECASFLCEIFSNALPLLLLICTINVAFSIYNDRGRPNNVRQISRISEYLVPPLPPRFHPPGRIPRLAKHQLNNEPGYFTRMMSWLKNPFGFSKSPPPLTPPPPLSPQPATPYHSKLIQPVPLSSATYNGPLPVDYEKPPLPPSFNNDHPGYPAPTKTKNCNPCDKVPWVPIQQGDSYHAASQEIRVPDFSYASPLPSGQDNSFISPIPNPHLFPGAIPPLFKAENFNYPPQVTPDKTSGYLGAPSSVSGNGAPTRNDSFPNLAELVFNGGHNGQSVYPGPSGHSGVVPQEPEYINPGASNGNFEPNDLSSSGTQLSHANPIPDRQGPEGTSKGSFDSINHQAFLGGPGVLDGQPSGVSNNGELYDEGPSGSAGGFPDASQTDNFPSSYGISNFDAVPNNYNADLSSSANVPKGSHAPLHTSDVSSGKIGDSINYEESPLLDFTREGESRPHSSSIPPTSNAFASFESVKNAGTTVAPNDKIVGTRQDITSTESHFFDNYFEALGTASKPFQNIMLKTYDDIAEETLNDNDTLHVTPRQQDGKRNKQIQVIIPYTSEHTPLPFHSAHERKISKTGESNHDSYVGEESKNTFNVVLPPNSSPIFPYRTTMKPVDTKANNSIDVHKLQKNIDNWTIQKYSKGTTASTEPNESTESSSQWEGVYLTRSKTIPKEYFTTTEPIGRTADSYNDNVKTITLGGFSFNDQEYKESASHHIERPHVRKIEDLIESSTDAPTIPEKDMWRSFSVGISSVNKERVYIVTPEPHPGSNSENRKQKALEEAESNTKESERGSQTNMKETKKSDTFESIEKAYQVLPQAVNNLAVASTGPESVPLWGIMEHEDFASPSDSEYDSNNTEPPTLYSRLFKESRAKR